MDSLKDLSQGPREGPDTQVKTAPGASFDHWILVALTSLLTACCSSSDSPIAVVNNNHPPRIITDSTLQMPEHRQLVDFLLAIDTDSDPVLWSISGGGDAALFRIDAEGRLKFIVAPDFENPADTNLDNLYELSVTVSDGISTDTKQLNIEVIDRLEGRVGGDPVTGAKVCNSEEYANSTYNATAANLSGSAWLLASTLSASNSKIRDSITGDAYASGKLSCNGYSGDSLGLTVSAAGALGTHSCGNSNPVACCK